MQRTVCHRAIQYCNLTVLVIRITICHYCMHSHSCPQPACVQLPNCHRMGTQSSVKYKVCFCCSGREQKLFGSCMQVEANDGESARSRLFRVTIKWAADVDVRALIRYVECAPPLTSPVSTHHRVTLHAAPSIMARTLPAALSIMLWHLVQESYTSSGR